MVFALMMDAQVEAIAAPLVVRFKGSEPQFLGMGMAVEEKHYVL
jgi:hypothetical protein